MFKKQAIKLIRYGIKVAKDNIPSLLTGAAVSGIIVTAVLTNKAALKADAYLKDNLPNATTDSAKKVIKRSSYIYYGPAAIAGLATVGCILGANYFNFKKLTAMAAAYSVAETALKENRSKVEEIFGLDGLNKVDRAIARDHISNEHEEITETGKGSYLCCEGYLTGTKFRASEDWVRRCVNDFNELVNMNTYASYNDFLTILGLHNVKYGDEIGWNIHINGLMRVKIIPDKDDGVGSGEPYLVFVPINAPVHNYGDIL